jgi:hypothetical protein
LRRRSVIAAGGYLAGVRTIVGGKEVRRRAGGQVAFGVDLHGLVEGAHAPLQHGPHRIVGVVEAQAEHVAHRPTDDALVVETGQLERAAAAADDAALGVADEESGVRGGVVVVEQLEQKSEAAPRAALRLTAEACGAIGLGGAVSAVRADEQMGHALVQG